MNIYDLAPSCLPGDAKYYFNILIINIAIRRSLQAGRQDIIKDIWDISNITESRPYVIHLYIDDDDLFEEDENFIMELYPNKAVEVSPSLGISFYDMFDQEDEDENEEEDEEQLDDPDELWRLG